MQVQNMTSNNGNKVANQFIITDDYDNQYFQSYDTLIAIIDNSSNITLDKKALDYSRTTSRYLYSFLNMDRKGILKAIDEGTISVINLN